MTGPQPELERPAHHARQAQTILDGTVDGVQTAKVHALLAIAGELRALNRALKGR